MMDPHFGQDLATGESSAEDHNQLPQEDTLVDRGIDDLLDEGYSPPDRPYAREAYGSSKNIDQKLAEEEPDPLSRLGNPFDTDEQQRSDESEREIEFPQRREVGRVRSGRLVSPDRGFGEDTESELIAEDVGLSGGAASAEEAAIHIIDSGE